MQMKDLKMKDLETQQKALVDLLQFAEDHGELMMEPETQEFLNMMIEAEVRPLSREELARLTTLTQELVALPAYTTSQAAAWLGITLNGVRHAIWQTDPPLLKTFKPGHDVLVMHDELVRYAQTRRYGGKNGQG